MRLNWTVNILTTDWQIAYNHEGRQERQSSHFHTGDEPRRAKQRKIPAAQPEEIPASNILTERLDEDTYRLVTTTSTGCMPVATDVDGKRAPMRILRPLRRSARTASKLQSTKSAATDSDAQGNRTLDIQLMVDMWNDVFSQHMTTATDCRMPKFAIETERKWGMGVAIFYQMYQVYICFTPIQVVQRN